MTKLRHDPEADAAYVRYSHEPVVRTREVDEDRLIDYSASDSVIGVEFLNVEDGVRVSGLPVDPFLLTSLLTAANLKVLDAMQMTSSLKMALVFTSASDHMFKVDLPDDLSIVTKTVFQDPKGQYNDVGTIQQHGSVLIPA